MRKVVNSVYYVVMAALIATIITIVSTGCQSDSGDDSNLPDFVYVPEIIPLPMPEDVEWISNIMLSDDSVYFSASAIGDEETPFHTFNIYRMDLTGSAVEKLPNYSAATEVPPEAEEGSVQIYAFCVDNDGNIWVAERGEFYYFPEDSDEDDWERWYKRTIVMEFTRIRKLDKTGAEILSFDISHLFAGKDWFHIYAFNLDSENNVYVGEENTIHVFNSEGNLLFSLDVPWIERLINLSDGTVAHASWGAYGRALNKIDVPGKKFGESINLPMNANNLYAGNEEYSFIFSDNNGLYGLETQTGEAVNLLNWIDSDMTQDGLGDMMLLPDGRILVISQTHNREGMLNELIFLTKTPYSELPERITLTLASFQLDWSIRSAIVKFNRESTTHRIHVTDYAEFSTDDDWQAGLTKLSAEIIAGNIPDILDVSNLPFNQYAAKGMLMDLYPLIDADPDLNRSDFIDSALRVTEINDKLYKIFPSFTIGTMLGNPEVVGSNNGWNMEDFINVIRANPGADYPLGQGLTKLNLLQVLFMFNMDNYVDWNEGKVYFDSDEFISLLEFTSTLPDDFDWSNEYIPEPELISSGRQIISAVNFNSFHDYQMYKALYGGEVVFKGLPAENKNGYSLMALASFAITEKCKDADAAWGFLKTFLDEDQLYENSWYGIPVIKNVFDKMIKDAMDEERAGSVGWDGFTLELKPLSQTDVDIITNLINSVSGAVGQDDAIWNIISEGVSAYFNGQSSAQDTARIIQNRATTYISEQS